MPSATETRTEEMPTLRVHRRGGAPSTIPEGVTVVLGAGAFGGLASWAYSLTVGRMLDMHWSLAALLCILLGAVAGLLGVYIIAKSDTRDRVHLIAFAVLCGLSWRPIIDGASAYVQLKNLNEEDAEHATTALAGGKPDEVADAAGRLMRTSARLNDPRRQPQAEALVAKSVESLKRGGPEAQKQLARVRAAAAASKDERFIKITGR